jgi:L-alanine-DL-glutamate epimerase-like enolase superfamily enzyme
LHIRAEVLMLELIAPFKISYGTSATRENVLVSLSDGVQTGLGEAAVVPYYGETPARVMEYLRNPALTEALGGNVLYLEDALSRLPATPSSAAHAGVDVALHDLWGKHLGQPLYRLWGLNPARCPLSSFTISMADTEDEYRALVRTAQEYPLLKLKLGSGSVETDLRYVEIACAELKGQFCVDANGGWSAADALTLIPRLAEQGALFIEQPVAKADWDGWRTLRARLPAGMPPLIADESVQGLDSVMPLAGLADGINIKLAKCGGLWAARQMITLARAAGMQVMIGCMVESAVAVTAAAHLAPLADYADLDANLLIRNDPFQGVQMVKGQLTLPDSPGLGVARHVE